MLPSKTTIELLAEMKKNQKKITAIVTYSYTMARRAEEAGIDVILVGDSATRVFSGLPDHHYMNVMQMLYHTQSVTRACQRAWVMADLPQESIEGNIQKAVNDAKLLIEEGKADSVKIEDSSDHAIELVEAFVKAKIPVVGHFLMLEKKDKRVLALKNLSPQGSLMSAMLAFGKALESAGCCALLLSKIQPSIASEITNNVSIPTIGIGSGPDCDGQILVLEDLLGLTYRDHPYFVKQYAQLGQTAIEAINKYIFEVQNKLYPDEVHSQPHHKNIDQEE